MPVGTLVSDVIPILSPTPACAWTATEEIGLEVEADDRVAYVDSSQLLLTQWGKPRRLLVLTGGESKLPRIPERRNGPDPLRRTWRRLPFCVSFAASH